MAAFKWILTGATSGNRDRGSLAVTPRNAVTDIGTWSHHPKKSMAFLKPMLPKHAYDHARDRAVRLLALHDGLVNQRKRRIRSDWKESFCNVMRWPKKKDIHRIDGKDALILLPHNSKLTLKDFHANALQELLRSALVLSVSALDRYMHERIVKNIVVALKKRNPSKEQSEFLIPAYTAIQVAHRVVQAGNNGKRVRPANEIRIAIQAILHKRTFQSWREVEDGFKLIGVSGLAGKLQHVYQLPEIKPKRDQLNKIADRRNRIVHEADLVRHKRGGKARLHPISAAEVKKAIDFLNELVEKLEAITA
jgi:hypothetical protein